MLYSEEIDLINENTLDYIIEKLGNIVRNKYADIINVDILNDILDNLKIKYPVLISQIEISKILEIIEREKRENDNITTEELIEKVCNQLERKDNIWVVLGTRE